MKLSGTFSIGDGSDTSPSAGRILVLVVMGLIIYSNTLTAPFQFDDVLYITDNPDIRNLSNFLNPLGSRYIGLLSFALNYAIGGYNTFGYHLVNIAIHITNSVILYYLVLLTFRTPFMGSSSGAMVQANNTAFAAALIFLSHPVQTQAVTYIAQRFASLATLFYMLSLLFYVKARLKMSEAREGTGRPGAAPFYILALITAVIAQKTKEISFTLPVVTALYEFAFFNEPQKRFGRLRLLLPFFLTMAIIPFEVLRPGIHGDVATGVGEKIRLLQMKDLENLSRTDYLLTQFTVIVRYLGLLIFPVNQNVLYDWPVARSFAEPRVFLCFLLLMVLFLGAVFLYLRSGKRGSGPMRLVSFGILWFFITLSVESSVIPIKHVIFEHRVYLPSVGLIVAATTALFAFSGTGAYAGLTPRRALIAVFVITALLSQATYSRNGIWTDPLLLWRDVAEKSPGLESAHFNLAWAYHKRGNLRKAIEHYRESLRLNPKKAKAHYNMAMAYQSMGEEKKAIEEFRKTLKLNPANKMAHYNLATILYGEGKTDEAIEHYSAAVKIDPAYEDAHYNLAWLYESTGDFKNAEIHYRRVIALNPRSTDAMYNLGLIYMKEGRIDEAIRVFSAVLRIAPGHSGARQRLERAMSMKRGGG